MKMLKRPTIEDTCRCLEARFVFVQKLGMFVHEDDRCRRPTRAYRDAAYEAGIIDVGWWPTKPGEAGARPDGVQSSNSLVELGNASATTS